MSGITGIYYLNNQPAEATDLGRMVDKLAHRGPDGANIWCDESVGLGHRMLWTTPESLLEKLPYFDHNRNLAITADARIDNREELITQLGLSDRPAEKITDSQLILAAYKKWGEDSPAKLLGAFAFAIWDGRKQQLFCARDHMGIKPFYYYHQVGHLFVFGSEIKAFLCLSEIPRNLNEERIADYLLVMFEDKSSTFYQDIFRLPPASSLIVSQRGIKIKSYWSLAPSSQLRLNSDQEYAEALREIFTEAVRCRLRSAFPIGSHLSGGLDSSSVTCVAKQLLQKESNIPLHTFSNIFDEIPECDERPFIQSVLDQGEFIPHFIQADQLSPLKNIDEILSYYDQVFLGPTHFLVWGCNHRANREGIRVVLDGFDGDTTISHGEGYLNELARQGKWTTFAKQAHDLSQLTGGSPLNILQNYGLIFLEQLAHQNNWWVFAQEADKISKHFDISKRQIFLNYGIKPLIPETLQQVGRRLRKSYQPWHQNAWIFNQNFTQKINLKERMRTSLSPPKILLTESQQHYQKITSGLMPYVMEGLDQSAATFSIESRHPFMDKRLIEFCLSLPPEQKLNKGWSRLIMRRAMTNILPEPVQWRRGKSNMTPSWLYGFLKRDHQVVNQVMQHHLDCIAAYVDTQKLSAAHQYLLSLTRYNSKEISLALDILKASKLSLWLRHL